MKRLLLLALFFAFARTLICAQQVVERKRIASVSAMQMDSLRQLQHVPRRLAPVRYGVDVYELTYTTRWWDGTPVKASGFYLVPQNCQESIPTVAYNHGTRLQRARTFNMRGEETLCAFFAADGYAVLIPDYLGLGLGERSHIYMHAATEATATIDMIRACKSINAELGIQANAQLFLTGYSQGGHAAMATHRYLQEHPELGMQVTASAPMSGAYDMVGVQSRVIDKPYSHPGYLPFLLLSYQEVYHLVPDSAAFFKAPYNTTLLPWFDGNHKLSELSGILPSVPGEVLDERLLAAYKNDPDNALRKALQENSLLDWAPEQPMLICYCKADEQVLYENALVARDSMEARGSELVRTRMAGRRFSHGPCALYTAIYAKMWFDSFRDGSVKGNEGPAWNRFLVSLSKMAYKKPKHKKKQHKRLNETIRP
jgi:pimeloyl-ACP methyl ester carboxylesterase